MSNNRLRFLGEEHPGLGMKHPPVPVRDRPVRATRHRVGRRRPPAPSGHLGRLVLAVHRVFEQRAAVPTITRLVAPAVRGHVDRHRPLLTQLHQPHPLTDPATAPAALPDHQHPCTEPVGLQIRDQRIEPTPHLARIPRRADRLIPIRTLEQAPALLTSHPNMIRVLLLQRPSPPRPIQTHPQVVPGTLARLPCSPPLKATMRRRVPLTRCHRARAALLLSSGTVGLVIRCARFDDWDGAAGVRGRPRHCVATAARQRGVPAARAPRPAPQALRQSARPARCGQLVSGIECHNTVSHSQGNVPMLLGRQGLALVFEHS